MNLDRGIFHFDGNLIEMQGQLGHVAVKAAEGAFISASHHHFLPQLRLKRPKSFYLTAGLFNEILFFHLAVTLNFYITKLDYFHRTVKGKTTIGLVQQKVYVM
jgi:hypothetical protein